MKQKSLLTSLLLFIGLGAYTILNTSNSSGFSSFQGSCGGCHGGSNAATSVSISGLPSFYSLSTAYPISVTVTNASMNGAGFQLQTNIGTLSTADPGININTGGLAASHNTKKLGTGSVTFNLTWTSPSTGSTPVTLNAVGNAARAGGFSNAQWNTATTNVALPVRFTEVVAKQMQTHVLVRFETRSEKHVKSFEIEKGTDGHNFKTIGTIKPSGDGTYEYKDYSTTNGAQYYYRIKEVSQNEAVTFSQVVKVSLVSKQDQIAIYPTVIEHNSLTITGLDNTTGTNIVMFDLFGRKVFSTKLESNQVDIEKLNTGYYVIAVYRNQQPLHAQKVYIK